MNLQPHGSAQVDIKRIEGIWKRPKPEFRSSLAQCRRGIRGVISCIRNWAHPPGLFLVILGPDGVGKSTAVQEVRENLGPLFNGCLSFHCRPFVLKRSENSYQVGRPHFRPPRGRWLSAIFQLGFFVDCWLGYLLATRPFLTKSGLVIFDRDFHDTLVTRDVIGMEDHGYSPKF